MTKEQVLNKMRVTGVSWCDSGKTATCETTRVCGSCVFFDPDKCDAVSDELEMCDD